MVRNLNDGAVGHAAGGIVLPAGPVPAPAPQPAAQPPGPGQAGPGAGRPTCRDWLGEALQPVPAWSPRR